jgi:N-acetylmuramoyl-L-alanine amidase
MRLRQWLVVLAVLVFALPVLADDSVTVKAYTFTRVRSGPGTTYSVIGFLVSGDTATATGRDSTDNTWLRIGYADGEGWVAASVVSVSGDPTTLDVVEPSNAQSNTGSSDVTVTTESAVNVRLGPGTSYRVVAQTTEGTAYDATGRSAVNDPLQCARGRVFDLVSGSDSAALQNVWVRINFNGFDGWVSYTNVSVSGDFCALSVEAASSVPDAVATVQGSVYIITQDYVRLRRTNYASSAVLATIPPDVTLQAEARNNDTSRIRVTYNNQTGWISVAYVSVERGSLDTLSVEQE